MKYKQIKTKSNPLLAGNWLCRCGAKNFDRYDRCQECDSMRPD